MVDASAHEVVGVLSEDACEAASKKLAIQRENSLTPAALALESMLGASISTVHPERAASAPPTCRPRQGGSPKTEDAAISATKGVAAGR
jgi:hypothetical protein